MSNLLTFMIILIALLIGAILTDFDTRNNCERYGKMRLLNGSEITCKVVQHENK